MHTEQKAVFLPLPATTQFLPRRQPIWPASYETFWRRGGGEGDSLQIFI